MIVLAAMRPGRWLVLAAQLGLALAPLACSHKKAAGPHDGGGDGAAIADDARADDARASASDASDGAALPDGGSPPHPGDDGDAAGGNDGAAAADQPGADADRPGTDATCVNLPSPDASAGDGPFAKVPHAPGPDGGDAASVPLAVPVDPTFSGVPAGAWMVDACTTLNAAAGRLEVPRACAGRTVLKQNFTIPAVAVSGPQALVFRASMVGDGDVRLTGCYDAFNILANGRQLMYAATLTRGDQELCLGEAAAGDVALTVDLTIAARGQCPVQGRADGWLERLAFVARSTCPTPGTIANGDFETDANWTPGARILAGVGDHCSGGLVLRSQDGDVPVTGLASPPLTSMARPALSIRYHGAGTEGLTVGLPGLTLGVLPPTTSAQFVTARLCLPEWSKGYTHKLTFTLPPESDGGGSAFVVDDLTFVEDTTCPAHPLVLDADFERADGGGWTFDRRLDDGAPTATSLPTGIDVDPANAHSGKASAVLTSGVCNAVSLEQPITLPPPAAGAGPAARFFYKLPGGTHASLYVNGGDAQPATATYAQRTQCLFAGEAATTALLRFELRGKGGVCQTPGSDTVHIDDIEIVNVPGCPTQ
jgi:hypothetical protein